MNLYEEFSVGLTFLGLIVSSIVLLLLVKQLRLLGEQVKDARRALDLSTAEAEAENQPAARASDYGFHSGDHGEIRRDL